MGKIQVAQQITFFFHLIVFVSFHLIPIPQCYYFFFFLFFCLAIVLEFFLRSRLANLFCNMPCCAVHPAADAVQHSTACIWKNDKTVLKNCSLLLLGCWITGALLIIDHHNMDDVFRNNITENQTENLSKKLPYFGRRKASFPGCVLLSLCFLLFLRCTNFCSTNCRIYFSSSLLLLLRVPCATKIKLQDSEIRCLSQYAIFFTFQLFRLHHYNCMLDSFFIFISFYWMRS